MVLLGPLVFGFDQDLKTKSSNMSDVLSVELDVGAGMGFDLS